jgi:hypothetical protein
MQTDQIPNFRSVGGDPREAVAPELERSAAPFTPSFEREEQLAEDHRVTRIAEDAVPRRAEDRPTHAAVAIARGEDITPSLTALDFSVHVSMRYHARRRAWYDRFHRMMMLVIAVAGSAGVAAIYGGLLREAEYLSIAVAVAGAIELAFSLPERARVEDALYRRFNLLAADIADAKVVADDRLRMWEAQRLLIRADADDRLEVLRRICHNLEAEARDFPAEDRYRIRSWQRLFAQLVSLPPLRSLHARR